MEHIFELQKYSGRASRHECPNCHDKHSFTLYVDANGSPINEYVGRCDHESGCGYHLTPSEWFREHPSIDDVREYKAIRHDDEPKREPSFIPYEWVYYSLSLDHNLTRFLRRIVDIQTLESPTIERISGDYLIGSTEDKSTVFWQIDANGKVRTAKIIQYNPDNGHRNKSIPPRFIHSDMKRKGLLPDDFNLGQCLFGEHLLTKNPDKKVGLVESEKTAVICSAVMPDYVWVACGGIGQLSVSKMMALEGREVIMFPDADGFEKWSEKAEQLRGIASEVTVSRLIEDKATPEQKAAKIDIADLIVEQLSAERAKYKEWKPISNLDILRSKNPYFAVFMKECGLYEA